MRGLFRQAWLLALWGAMLASTGCRPDPPAAGTQGAEKTYKLRGKIISVDTPAGSVTVQHGAIAGFMEPMTMSYRLVDPATIGEFHPGDVITARMLVKSDAAGPLPPRLDQVVIVAQARPDTLPAVQYHVPTPGDDVPDFHLLNQSGKLIHLGQFKGKALLITFIYTRCPLADFCPRMSENFAEIDKDLAADPKVYARTHLLSISFDPAYDTPAVLRSYGGAHTGRFTEEDFRHWDFAAPSPGDLPRLEAYFNVGVTGAGDPQTLAHSLSTVLIGRDGKIVAWYPTKDWKPAELADAMRAAAR